MDAFLKKILGIAVLAIVVVFIWNIQFAIGLSKNINQTAFGGFQAEAIATENDCKEYVEFKKGCVCGDTFTHCISCDKGTSSCTPTCPCCSSI